MEATNIDLLLKRDRHEPYSKEELAKAVSAAVDAIVARQVGIGVDVVSDGESSKAGYSNYIRERLSGFSGPRQCPGLHMVRQSRCRITAPCGT